MINLYILSSKLRQLTAGGGESIPVPAVPPATNLKGGLYDTCR